MIQRFFFLFFLFAVRPATLLLGVSSLLFLSGCGGLSSAPTTESSVPDKKPVAQAAADAPYTDDTRATLKKPVTDADNRLPPARTTTSARPKQQRIKIQADTKIPTQPTKREIAACWLALSKRLQNDPNAPAKADRYFCNLPEYSPMPMASKVKELFTNAFLRVPKVPGDDTPKPSPFRIYRNIVTPANIQRCAEFLAHHQTVVQAVEKKYPVPKEILVALLFVETRLGSSVGKKNAFWSLACMAAANTPARLGDSLSNMPITNAHTSWLQTKLTDKSNWAYKEMRSLLTFCSKQSLDPHAMPGSVYGAIGICQFMPSNLIPYGDDGDGDGTVNPFSEADAVFSAANYLTKHGWATEIPVPHQRAVLMRYNKLTIYANTILTLAESLRTGIIQIAPPDAVKQAIPPGGVRTSMPKKRGKRNHMMLTPRQGIIALCLR